MKMRKLRGFPKCHFFNTFFINKLYKWVTLNLCSMIACILDQLLQPNVNRTAESVSLINRSGKLLSASLCMGTMHHAPVM